MRSGSGDGGPALRRSPRRPRPDSRQRDSEDSTLCRRVTRRNESAHSDGDCRADDICQERLSNAGGCHLPAPAGTSRPGSDTHCGQVAARPAPGPLAATPGASDCGHASEHVRLRLGSLRARLRTGQAESRRLMDCPAVVPPAHGHIPRAASAPSAIATSTSLGAMQSPAVSTRRPSLRRASASSSRASAAFDTTTRSIPETVDSRPV